MKDEIKIKKNTFFLIIVLFIVLNIEAGLFYNSDTIVKEVCFYAGTNEQLYDLIENQVERFGIKLIKVDKLDKNNKKLHIICDAYLIPIQYFPERYIVYQTLNFEDVPLTHGYLDKLNHAVAIWDPSWKNISKYSLSCDNYYHFSLDRIDPLILPCLIPTKFLAEYQKLLGYSNHKDTDISSHLPVIFVHSLLQQPKIAIESGVRSGESSLAFKSALESLGAKLIGIDIDQQSVEVYDRLNLSNSEFKVMDDLNFSAWWHTSALKDQKSDIIFIDTSHYYDHTLKELAIFVPLLNQQGFLMFHDTNQCPHVKNTYQRINNTYGAPNVSDHFMTNLRYNFA
jgi:predicted O-methyltransferase YrrM